MKTGRVLLASRPPEVCAQSGLHQSRIGSPEERNSLPLTPNQGRTLPLGVDKIFRLTDPRAAARVRFSNMGLLGAETSS